MIEDLVPGIVIIGRNEGERLVRSLTSCLKQNIYTVYVDSGSSDGSVETATSFGVDVVELEASTPFSAARARNEGVSKVQATHPDINIIQFIDGDCELFSDWITKGKDYLTVNQDAVVVCGVLHEQFPDASIYNRICDLEWDTTIGELNSCGGIFIVRLKAFVDVGGFNPSIVAGEEPELCSRLRLNDGKIIRIDADMAKHDAAMLHFSQWWTRGVRNGYGGADLMWNYGKNSSKKLFLGNFFWIGIIPLSLLISFLSSQYLYMFILLIYPVKVLHITLRSKGLTKRKLDPLFYALDCMLSKFPALVGNLKYVYMRMIGKSSKIITHK